MSDAVHYRKLEKMYLSAPCNGAYDPKISIGEGKAEVSFSVKPEMFHAGGSIHGSVYFKLLDDAAFFSAASLVADRFVLTSSFNIYLLRPVTRGIVRAVGSVVSAGKRQLIAEAVATNEAGKTIARGSGCFMKSDIAYGEEMGYRD